MDDGRELDRLHPLAIAAGAGGWRSRLRAGRRGAPPLQAARHLGWAARRLASRRPVGAGSRGRHATGLAPLAHTLARPRGRRLVERTVLRLLRRPATTTATVLATPPLARPPIEAPLPAAAMGPTGRSRRPPPTMQVVRYERFETRLVQVPGPVPDRRPASAPTAAAPATPHPATPHPVAAVHDPGPTGFPSPGPDPTAPPPEASHAIGGPPVLPGPEVDRIADQVLYRIERRAIAQHERLGKPLAG